MTALIVHKLNEPCPRVRSGEWVRCLGHADGPPLIKKKRRRIDLSLRLEEARAALEALEDARDWIRDAGELDQNATYVGRLERVAGLLREGVRYVTEVNPTRPLMGFVVEVDPTGDGWILLVEVADQYRRLFSADRLPCAVDELLAHTVKIQSGRLWLDKFGWFKVKELSHRPSTPRTP